MSDIDFEMLRDVAIELTSAKQFRYAAEVHAAAQRIRELEEHIRQCHLAVRYWRTFENRGLPPMPEGISLRPTQEQEG